jgi:hypothetical protein
MQLPFTMTLAFLLLLAGALPSRAEIIGADSGNSTAANTAGTLQGSINFAVYANQGGSRLDVFGTGYTDRKGIHDFDTRDSAAYNVNTARQGALANAAFDVHAKYLYVYQITNNGPNPHRLPISEVFIPLNPRSVTSFGVLEDPPGTTAHPLGFTDNRGSITGLNAPAGSSKANNLGPEHLGPAGQILGFQPNAPANLIGLNAKTFSPGEIDKDGPLFSSVALESGGLDVDIPDLKAGNRGTLFFFTSNVAPSFVLANLEHSGACPATGMTVAPQMSLAPAPPTATLCVLAMAGFGAAHGLRRCRRLA